MRKTEYVTVPEWEFEAGCNEILITKWRSSFILKIEPIKELIKAHRIMVLLIILEFMQQG